MAMAKSTRDTQVMRSAEPTFVSDLGWLKPFCEGPANLYRTAWGEAARLAARGLQDQAHYMKKLSECTEPLEALRCHGEFLQQSWTRCFEDGSRALDAFRTGAFSGLAQD